jgi:hypothetical protein
MTRFGPEVSLAVTMTLGLLYVSLRVCRQCRMQSDKSAMVEIRSVN